MYQNISDEELAKLSLEDQSAFGELVVRYQEPLGRFVRRKARVSDQDIEDILQDVFIKVYVNLNGFDTALKFSSWIYRITYNHVISWYRKQKVRPHDNVLETDEDVFSFISSDLDIEREHVNDSYRQALVRAIEDLQDKYRDVMVLRFFEDKDYEEISDILEIPPGTVATRLNRAKAKLKEMLQKYE